MGARFCSAHVHDCEFDANGRHLQVGLHWGTDIWKAANIIQSVRFLNILSNLHLSQESPGILSISLRSISITISIFPKKATGTYDILDDFQLHERLQGHEDCHVHVREPVYMSTMLLGRVWRSK